MFDAALFWTIAGSALSVVVVCGGTFIFLTQESAKGSERGKLTEGVAKMVADNTVALAGVANCVGDASRELRSVGHQIREMEKDRETERKACIAEHREIAERLVAHGMILKEIHEDTKPHRS